MVTLSSNNTDVARVGANVTIAAGSTSNTVNIDVTSVQSNTTVTITGTYSGVSKTGTFTVTPTPLEARYTVISRTKGANACVVEDVDGRLDCEFDASGSFGNIDQFQWRLILENDNYDENRSTPKASLSPPCSFLHKGTKGDDESVPMTVELRLRGKDGSSTSAVSKAVKLFRGSNCPS